MTTNQTIDGVSRELLERCARELSIGIGPAPKNRAQELRALLDAPATEERGSSHGFEQSPNTCRHDERAGVWWREGSITRTGRECCACGSVEEDPVESAAQPQGEPVAYEKPHYDNHYGYAGGYVDWGCPRDVKAVLDHVESVLDSVPEGPLYAEQPAPVAVVLPERLAMTGRGLMDAPTVNHHLGWNACLNELKRLNPSL